MTTEFVNVKPVIVADAPDAHQVWLDVGCQHFTVGDYCETKEEAEWLAVQLVTAIDAMLPVIAEQEFDSVIADMQAQAKTFLNTENTEIFGWIKRLKAWQAALQGGSPVYQRYVNESWVDIPKENYDQWHGKWQCRTLYTHPPEAKDAEVAEKAAFADGFDYGFESGQENPVGHRKDAYVISAWKEYKTTTPRGG